MKSIRSRILLAFLLLGVLITPFVLFSISSLNKISKAKVLQENVAQFNLRRLKAARKFSQFMDTDTKIDSFYLHGTTINLNEFDRFIASATAALSSIESLDVEQDLVVEKRLQNVSEKLTRITFNINQVIHLQKKIGFKDFGLEGAMRKSIHRLEQETVGISLAENLMLRRREKDFFLRGDPSYAVLLNKQADSIIQRMSLELDQHLEPLAILQAYQKNFNEIVALKAKIGNANQGLLQEIASLDGQIDHEVHKLQEIIATNLKLLSGRVQSYVILFFCITVLFVVFFTFAFSGHLANPIKRLIRDMDDAADKNFEGNFKIKTSINVREINQLADTYNTLAQKIRHQIKDLNEKNQELNLLNEKLRESENELQEASGIKDKFFSIISHDLRGHTGNVISLAQILNEDSALSEKEKSVFTKYLLDASQNLQLLLDNLLNWAKTQMNDHTISKKAFNVTTLIEKNIDLVADNALRKGVKIEFSATEVPKAYADKDMVDFIIRNLISNALKFTKKEDRILLTIKEANDFLEIQVKDTGVGMTQGQIAQLLHSEKENSSTKGTQNEVGTGLGFAICRDFVHRNGGAIQITSTKGKGSTFSFTLPTKLTRDSILSS